MALPNSSKLYPKIVEICKLDTSITNLHDRPFSWHSTGTSMTKSGGIKLVLWTQTSPLSEMMRGMPVFSTCDLNSKPHIQLGHSTNL